MVNDTIKHAETGLSIVHRRSTFHSTLDSPHIVEVPLLEHYTVFLPVELPKGKKYFNLKLQTTIYGTRKSCSRSLSSSVHFLN